MQGYHSINESINDNDLDSEIQIIDDDDEDGACYHHNHTELLSNRVKIELLLVFVTVFIVDIARGIVVPSLSDYSDALHGERFYYGVLIGTFGIGTLIFAPLLGWLSSSIRVSNWIIFTVAMGFVLIGSMLYGLALALSEVFSFVLGRTAMVSARTILGAAVGTIAVARAHVSMLTTQSQRTSTMTLLTGSQFASVTLTPIIGSAICSSNIQWEVVVNCFTAPGFLLMILSTTMAIVLVIAYRIFPSDSRSVSDPEEMAEKKEQKKLLIMPTIGRTSTKPTGILVLLMAINSVIMGASEVVETQGGEFFFGLFSSALGSSGDGSDPISDFQYDGYFFLVIGVIGLTIFGLIYLYSLKYKSKLFDFSILLIGLMGLAIGALLLIQLRYESATSQHARGNYSYSTSTFDKIRFLMGSFLILGFARPLATTGLIALVSKALPDDKQGWVMGWLTAFGALGQICFPIFSRFGSETLAFCVAAILTGISITGILMFRQLLLANSLSRQAEPEQPIAYHSPPATTPLIYPHRR